VVDVKGTQLSMQWLTSRAAVTKTAAMADAAVAKDMAAKPAT